MARIPERASLVAQVADVLRDGIHSGEWRVRLPGTRALSEQLQVSRPTLRAALALLRREGFIRVSHGRHVEITLTEERRRKHPRSNVIGFLSPIPLTNLSYLSLFLICDLQRRLADAGFKLEIHSEKRFQQRQPFKALESLVSQTRAACWILHFSTPDIQRWFSERQIPAIVSKARHEGVRLPSFDFDYRAIGTHAAGVLLGLNHHRVTLVTSRKGVAADLLLERGLRERMESHAASEAKVSVAHHDGSPRGIQTVLAGQLRVAQRPTALLVAGGASAVTVLDSLVAAGLRVPGDVSLVCSTDDPILDYCVPSVARYRVNWETYARRLGRLVIHLATSGTLAARRTEVMPELFRGESLGPAPVR